MKRVCHAHRISSLFRYSYVLCQFLKYMWIARRLRSVNECIRSFKSNRTAGQSDDIGGCQCRHKQAVPNTMQFVVGRLHCPFSALVPKGLLSIPCDGRGARRPLGQSFHESVGPAVHLYLPLAQSVRLSAQVSGRVIAWVKATTYRIVGCFNLPSSEDLVGILARRQTGHCLTLGLNFAWGVQ